MSDHPEVPNESQDLIRHMREFHSLPEYLVQQLRYKTTEQLREVHKHQHQAQHRKTGRWK